MKNWAWVLVAVLLILHQDYWQWERSEIVFGFLPYPLAYNLLISVMTAMVWILVTTWSWPACPDEERSDGLPDGGDRE